MRRSELWTDKVHRPKNEEIDRLRTELADQKLMYDSLSEGYTRLRKEGLENHVEIDRLQQAFDEATDEIVRLRARLNDFTDPKTPGMVSVGLLNGERETSDRLRAENAELREDKAKLLAVLIDERRSNG